MWSVNKLLVDFKKKGVEFILSQVYWVWVIVNTNLHIFQWQPFTLSLEILISLPALVPMSMWMQPNSGKINQLNKNQVTFHILNIFKWAQSCLQPCMAVTVHEVSPLFRRGSQLSRTTDAGAMDTDEPFESLTKPVRFVSLSLCLLQWTFSSSYFDCFIEVRSMIQMEWISAYCTFCWVYFLCTIKDGGVSLLLPKSGFISA